MELGSEYSLDLSNISLCENNIYKYLQDYTSIFFDCGRSALKALVSILKVGNVKALLPEYICESVISCFCEQEIEFYKLDKKLNIDTEDLFNKVSDNTAIIFLMHYAGMVQDSDSLRVIRKMADERGIIIIEDTTHSIFSKKQTIGDYMISSIRKWMPVPKAGVLYSKDDSIILLEEKYQKSEDNKRAIAMVLKDQFLRGNLDCNLEYRRIFEECEEAIDNQKEIYLASDYSKYIMKCVDISKFITIRRSNYKYLEEKLKNTSFKLVNHLKSDECPFVYLIESTKRNQLRRYLIDNKIYCAVHWPEDGIRSSERPQAEYAANNYLSLPIDQRYSENEMEYLVKTLLAFDGE